MAFLGYTLKSCTVLFFCICSQGAPVNDGSFSITVSSRETETQDNLHSTKGSPYTPSPSSMSTKALGCQSQLSFKIEQCLQRFESRYLVYNDEDSSLQLQEAMEKMLCREYEQSLQCLHFALQDCPPADFHLHMMGARLGHVRDLMEGICSRTHSTTDRGTTTTDRGTTTTDRNTTTAQSATSTSGSTTTTTTTMTTKETEILLDIKNGDIELTVVKSEHEALNDKELIIQNSETVMRGTNKLQIYEDKQNMGRKNDVFINELKDMKAKENEILDKQTFKSERIIAELDTMLEVPQPLMKAQVSDCNGQNVDSNPKCSDVYMNSARGTSSGLWTCFILALALTGAVLS